MIQHAPPKTCNNFFVVEISCKIGILESSTFSAVNIVEINIGSAAFFAPEIRTSPPISLWPWTINLSKLDIRKDFS